MRLALIAALLAAAPHKLAVRSVAAAAEKGPQAATATEAMQKRDAQIRAALPPIGTEPSAAQKAKAQDLLTEFIDFRGMAQAALGKHWTTLSEAKRKELLAAFTKRFKQATLNEIDFYRSTAIKYEPEQKQDDQVLVPTSMVVKGEPTHVTYAMKPNKGSWLIEDIIIDDVSTIENYRSAFNKVIDKSGIDGLIAKLNKNAETMKKRSEASAESDGGKATE